MADIRLRRLQGALLQDALEDLASLRLTVFREWPYLYDGDARYERDYIGRFAASPGAVIIGAYQGDQMVGAATGAPLKDHFDEFAAPLVEAGYRAEDLFYFGESVLLETFRGRGIGVGFFIEREKAALEAGFDRVVFCSVIRPPDHPMRPHDYVPLDSFWRRRGYRPLQGVIAQFPWKDIGAPGETQKPMQFWMKSI
ncbi:MAG: GNAT family N-acetyltransferase [Rhizobiaceae bacterium]|nr:GNAT family N-acetyltransferase [Rhizobiaceae bacterium]